MFSHMASWERLSKYALHVSTPFEVYLLKWTHYAEKIIFHFLFDDMMYFSNTWRPHQSFSFCCIIIEIWYSFHPPPSSPLSPPLHWQARQRLMQRLAETEEQYDGLRNCHSETEIELANTRASLNDRKTFCQQLQDDCENMTQRVSSWADDQR